MKQAEFRKRVAELFRKHEKLITRKNVKAKSATGRATGMQICLRGNEERADREESGAVENVRETSRT